MLFRVQRLIPCKLWLHSPLSTSFKWSNVYASTRNSSIASDSMMNSPKEEKINVNGTLINYVKVGQGEHPILLLPGALGTIWTDFKPQIEGMDKRKLTIVAWDPPGYGESRPPDRKFPEDFFERDADDAHGLMKALGYPKYSLVGWSDGGITSLILAAKRPECMTKLVVLGSNSYILPNEIKIYESIKNIDTWSERMKAPLIAAYGEDYFRKTWAAWVDGMINIYKNKNGDLCKELLGQIKCPTLIIHGKKDVMVDPEHPVYLKNHISNSKLEIIEKGAHNLHLRYPEEINKMITNFVLDHN